MRRTCFPNLKPLCQHSVMEILIDARQVSLFLLVLQINSPGTHGIPVCEQPGGLASAHMALWEAETYASARLVFQSSPITRVNKMQITQSMAEPKTWNFAPEFLQQVCDSRASILTETTTKCFFWLTWCMFAQHAQSHGISVSPLLYSFSNAIMCI